MRHLVPVAGVYRPGWVLPQLELLINAQPRLPPGAPTYWGGRQPAGCVQAPTTISGGASAILELLDLGTEPGCTPLACRRRPWCAPCQLEAC